MSVSIGDLLRRTHGLWEYIDEGGEGAKRLRELERELVEAHIRETALIQENAALKQTVADYENFDVEKQHYVPQQKPSSAWVIGVRPGADLKTHFAKQGMEFCAHCFFKRQLSILQPIEKQRSPAGYLKCHTCSAEVMVGKPHDTVLDFDC